MAGWSPHIGDPTIIGWVTVIAYFSTVALCLRAGKVAYRKRYRRGIWPLLAVATVALGVNKQLDLQTFIVSIGRAVARDGGWYDDRAKVQLAFIIAVAILGGATCVTMAVFARHGSRSERWAMVGVILLCTFVVVRAASFHHIDRWLGLSFTGVRINQVLELGGIVMIAIPALAAGFGKSKRRTRRWQPTDSQGRSRSLRPD